MAERLGISAGGFYRLKAFLSLINSIKALEKCYLNAVFYLW